MVSSSTKVCTKCGIEQSIENFYERSDQPGKRRYECKPCLRASNRERHKRYLENPDWVRRRDRWLREGQLAKDYGISLSTYQRMFDRQGGRCAVCGESEYRKVGNRTVALCVDHDHRTGEVRALLCNDCNTALGLMREGARRISMLLDYATRFKEMRSEGQETSPRAA